MIDLLEDLKNEFEKEMRMLKNLKPNEALKFLGELKIKYSGKKSEFVSILRKLGSLKPEDRPSIGSLANNIKREIENLIQEKLILYGKKVHEEELENNNIDLTLPGRPFQIGSLHPLTKVEREIINIFSLLGFEVADGPELEDDFHNFEALNIGQNHPARDMQDTLYINDRLVLRTQTSSVQIRVMEKRKPPIRIISGQGRVYRSDYDPTHSPMFTQLEGLVVDKNISFSDLKGTLGFFIKKMFGVSIGFRLRASYFPFTEPSAEVDMECIFCKSQGCSICKGSGWLEILGCGMVNPKVFEAVGYNPRAYTGFAFGMGIERITMLKYGVNDLRAFFENDKRLLEQF